MKKYFLLIALAVFAFTACEKDVEREPSPAANKLAASFAESSIVVDVNPVKAPLEYAVTLVRSNPEEALTVGIEVLEGDKDVISVPATASFAAKEESTKLLLSFPSAKMDKTYSIRIAIKLDNQSPYLDGNSQLDFTVNIASWEPSPTMAIVFDGLVGSMYGVECYGWYVDYQQKENGDGSFDVRLLNPYASYATADADQFGFFDGYPYNAAEEVLAGDYPWILHIAADNTVTFDDFKMGMLWSADYGEFLAGLTEGEKGTYDPELKQITFKGGQAWATMSNLANKYTWDDQDLVIYLDATGYQNDHLTIEDFNDPSIEWVAVETGLNVFESSIFEFVDEEQKLFKAVNPLPDNPKSPFINLYCLKDVYAEGGNLAFYWDPETDEFEIPSMQNTHISFLKRDLVIYSGEAMRVEEERKGVTVSYIIFSLELISTEDDYVGAYDELFTFAYEPIIYEKADFLGDFNCLGYSQFGYGPALFPVQVKEENNEMFMLGLNLVDTVYIDFDPEAGEMYFFPQQVGNIIHPQVGEMYVLFLTSHADGSYSQEDPMIMGYSYDGYIKLTKSSPADGYLLYGETIDESAAGWLDGYYGLTLESTAAGAPARMSGVHAPMSILPKATKLATREVRNDQPTTKNLKFNGKIDRRPLRKEVR